MGAIIQINPSTLKVLYNPVTKKVLTLECPHCTGPLPARVTVEFTGVTECGCVVWAGSKKITPNVEPLVNAQHEVIYRGNVNDVCTWEKIVLTTDYIVSFYASADCTGAPWITHTSSKYHIMLRRYDIVNHFIDLRFWMYFPTLGIWLNFFHGKKEPCTDSGECLCGTDWPLSNLLVCGSGDVAFAFDGEADIV